MERIREAITRARDTKDKTVVPPQPPAARPIALTASATPQSDSFFKPVACNFTDFGKHRIIANEQDPVLNAYRVLRTRVLQRMETEGWKTIAVVSPGAGAGKTVTAINLAIAIGSKKGSRATLVDLDFYRPSVARYLGLKEIPSVLDFFEGKRALEDVTVQPDLTDVLLIANERVTRRGAEYLTSDLADHLIEKTTNDYGSRVVVFDMSPLLGCDDSIAFLPKVDCALFVAASGETRVQEFKEAQRILRSANTIGTVLNKAPSSMTPNQYY